MTVMEYKRKVSPERTGWRDKRISERHRDFYGFDCPGVDIDFLLVEYDHARACAIVDYKQESLQRWNPNSTNMRALKDLGDRAKLPAFVCAYADDFSWYYPIALNDAARRFLPQDKKITEKQWVELLYHMRGRSLPKDLKLRDVSCN